MNGRPGSLTGRQPQLACPPAGQQTFIRWRRASLRFPRGCLKGVYNGNGRMGDKMPFLIFRSIGPVDLLIILAIVVFLFGATRFAGIGRGIGRAIREFRREVKETGEDGDSTTTASTDESQRHYGQNEVFRTSGADPDLYFQAI